MYGEKNAKISEKTNFNSKSLYGTYKVHSFYIMRVFKKIFNLRTSCLILFNHDSIYRNKKFLFPRIINHLKTKNLNKINQIYKENIYGDFSHADDICNGILKLMETKRMPDKIIFSSFKSTSVNRLIDYGMNFFKIKVKMKKNNNISKKLLIGNNNFAYKKLNWRPKKNIFLAFKELLKNT